MPLKEWPEALSSRHKTLMKKTSFILSCRSHSGESEQVSEAQCTTHSAHPTRRTFQFQGAERISSAFMVSCLHLCGILFTQNPTQVHAIVLFNLSGEDTLVGNCLLQQLVRIMNCRDSHESSQYCLDAQDRFKLSKELPIEVVGCRENTTTGPMAPGNQQRLKGRAGHHPLGQSRTV